MSRSSIVRQVARRLPSPHRLRGISSIVAALALALGWQIATATAADAASIRLSTPYPSVVVEPGETVSLKLEVDSSPTQHVDLDVDAPKGWKTTLRGGGFVVNGVRAD